MPRDAAAVVHVKGLASEYKAFAANRAVIGILEKAGMDERDIENFQRNAPGVYWTLFGLTGRDTVLAWEPGIKTQWGRLGGHIAGASHTGWRAKIIELLWRLKWAPGIGKLHVTARGTRYIVLDIGDDFEDYQFLSLDISDGVLLATLSDNPDSVINLASRFNSLGPRAPLPRAFNADRNGGAISPPARGQNFRFWLSLDAEPPFNAELGSFAKEDLALSINGIVLPSELPSLSGAAPFAKTRALPSPCADIPAQAAQCLAIAGDARLLSSLLPSLELHPNDNGIFAACATGKPFEGRIFGIAVPYAGAGLAFAEAAPAETFYRGAKAALDAASASAGGVFAPFAANAGKTLSFGTDSASKNRQRQELAKGAPSFAAKIDAWRDANPDALAIAEADLALVGDELRKLSAAATLASRFIGGAAFGDSASTIEFATKASAILSTLGTLRAVAIKAPDGLVKINARIELRRAE